MGTHTQQHTEAHDGAPIPTTPASFIWYATMQYPFRAGAAFAVVTAAQLCGVFLPYVLKRVIDAAQYGGTDMLFWVVLFPTLMISMFFLYRISGFVGMQWLTRVESFAYNILFAHLTKHSHTYFSNRFAGSVSNKLSHAAEGTFRILDSTLWGHWGAIITLISTGIFIFYTNVWVGCIYVLLITILIPMNYFYARYRRPFVVAYSAEKTKLRGNIVDVVTNIAAMRQYARRETEIETARHGVEMVRQKDVRQWKISEWGLLINNVLIGVAVAVMLGVMYVLYQDEKVSSGDFVLVLTLIMSLSSTLVFIGNAMNQFIRMYGEVDEGLSEILIPYDINDVPESPPLNVSSPSIVWKDVTFQYHGDPIFKDFNLDIPAYERVGLVGSSGAGKTTFVSLLLRQHELTHGAILIDGQDIARVSQDSLRAHISVVPQEPMLFHRTIRENIAYGKPGASRAEIRAVAQKAQADDFIMALPEGYETLVGERGVKLSGGQKQRVAIARAMLKNAPMLILDEATSALDSESEVAIQKALHELMVGKTVIAIAHRLSTLREMDRIIVLEKGVIVADGTHTSLKRGDGVYARLWKHQAGGFLPDA